MKRFLIIAFFAITIVVPGCKYFQKKNTPITKEPSNYKAIPIDSPLFFEFNSMGSFPTKSKIFSSLNNSGFFTPFFGLISRLDSIISTSKEIDAGLKNYPVLIALNLEGRENYIPLIVAKAETGTKKNNLDALVSRLFPANKYRINKRQYNGENIYDFDSGNPNESFSYSFVRGLFIASPKSIVVEKAIRQLETEGLEDDPGFKQINKTATQQSQISIYINHKYFPGFIKNWASSLSSTKTNEFGEEVKTNYKNNIAGFSNFALWSELDLTSKDNELRLYGVSVVPDSVGQYLAIFKRQDAIKTQIDRALPADAAMLFSLSFSNRKTFFEDLDKYFTHSEIYYSREEKIKKINALAQANLVSVFENIVDNEIAMSFINVPGDPTQKSSCFIVSTKGKSQAREEMTKWMTKYATRNRTRLDKMTSSYKIDKETIFEIYSFPFASFPGIWLGKPFSAVSANFFAYWDNFIIFANTRQTLENLLNELTLESSLSKDMDYLQFKQNIENKANLTFYLNINNGYNLAKEYFSDDIIKIFKSKETDLRKFGSVCWQLTNSNNILFNNIYLAYSDEVKENAKTSWQSNIGAKINSCPQFVDNQNDRKKKDILVQDVNYVLHLITSEGRAKWGIPIPEKIIGGIHEIDFRKNGDIQFLFNTKSKIYLIDHEGNNVSPYPMALRSPATNEISIADYENNKNYRFFIAGEDKKIYAYESSGNLLKSWNFGKTDQVVTTPVQLFKVDGKDFIVFKDKVRFYILDRAGKSRIKFATKFENSKNPIILDRTGTSKMVVTDIKGMVYYLYFNGKIASKKIPEMSESHFFTASDLDGNGILDFVFADKDELSVFDEKGTKCFSTKFKGNINYPPEVFTFAPKLKNIGVVCPDENRIYLYNPDGSLHPGFPMKGNSRFSIGQIIIGAKFNNLVVGSNDGKIYNYKLD